MADSGECRGLQTPEDMEMPGLQDKCKKAVELVEARIKEEGTYDPVFNPTKPKPYYKTFCFILTLIVFIISSTGTIILWGTDYWNTSILKVLTFEKQGLIYNFWRAPDIDTIIKIYPFNYTNIGNISFERPHVEEVGPYIFIEKSEKLNILYHSNGSVTYSENRTHEFDELTSNGSLDDIIYTPNVPLMSASAAGASTNIISQLGLAAILKGLDTRPFLPIDIEGFAMGFDDSFSVVARKLSAILKGNEPPKFGLLASRNGVSSERVTIGTGVPDLEGVGVISNSDGQYELDFWNTDECNTITGSDGSIFPGNVVKRTNRLYIYVKNFCRRIPIEFYGERRMAQNFPAKRYELPSNIYDLPSENPENACYCSSDQCSPKGTFSTSICNFGAPMLISFPHFLYGDPMLRENVTGLHPDKEKHKFFFDIHETLGIPVGGNSRFQVNVVVRHCPFLSQLNALPSDTVLPIAWVDIEFGELRGKLKELVHHATYTFSYIYSALSWSSLLLMLITLGRLSYYFYYKR